MLLRQGQNGVILNGAADGAALIWNAAAREWFSANTATAQPTFASVQALAAADLSSAADQTLIAVGTINDTYLFVRAPAASVTAAIDGVNIVAAAAPAGAVYVRQFVANPQAWLQTTWSIDPVNGNDTFAGTALAPLKTARELFVRWNNGRLLAPAYTVTIAAGDAGKLGRVNVEFGRGTIVTVQGTLSSTAARAITAVTATGITTNTRGAITDAGGAFARSQRLRLVSGAATGALTVCQGGTVAAAAVVTGWSTIATLSIPTPVEPAPGDQYVTDTYLTTLHVGARFELRGCTSGRIIIRDCNWTTDPSSSFAELESFQVSQAVASTIPANPQVYFVACQFDGNANARWTSGAGVAKCTQCLFQSAISISYSACVAFDECTFQAGMTVGFQSFVQNDSRWTFDGGSMILKNAYFELNGGAIQAGATAVGGICIEFLLGATSYWHGGGRLWGPTSGYAVGVRIHGFANFGWDASTLPTLAGSTNDAVYLTSNMTWAALGAQQAVAPANTFTAGLMQGVA